MGDKVKMASRCILVRLLIGFPVLMMFDSPFRAQQTSLEQLQAKLQQQYAAIYHLFANGPGKQVYPSNPQERIHRWQDDLAHGFANALA